MSDEVSLSPGHKRFLSQQAERIQALRVFFQTELPGDRPITLEIGCGHGHYLTAYAQAHPESLCLGIDIVTKRIRKACQKRDKRGLGNLHFLKAEVREFFMACPDNLKLERVFILFPDPWPKKRHIKNRIIQDQLLTQIATHACPETLLHFRTDHSANFAWGHERIDKHRQWKVRDEAPWPFESPSFFQDLLGSRFSLSAVFVP